MTSDASAEFLARIDSGSLAPVAPEFCAFLMDEMRSIPERGLPLEALHRRGETPEEVAAFVEVFLAEAVDPGIDPLRVDGPIMDVCGTGGDGRNLFNISTAVMFVVAGGGVSVVKHGNRSITSKCGGADVLEALGVDIHAGPLKNEEILRRSGCTFLFAPDYHPGFRRVAPVRQWLASRGGRSVFNLLGPLLNPARPALQLAGVFDVSLTSMFCRAMAALGRARAWAVHGGAGEDEVSLFAPTRVSAVSLGAFSDFEIDPLELGFHRPADDGLQGSDAAGNAEIIVDILSGTLRGAHRDVVVLNAAAAFVIAERAETLQEGCERANEAIDSGRALRVLQTLREAAKEPGSSLA